MERICKNCGAAFTPGVDRGRPALHCSSDCTQAWARANRKAKLLESALASKPLCAHPLCTSVVPLRRSIFCSKRCQKDNRRGNLSPYGFGDRCAVWFKPCPRCGVLVTMKARNQANLCAPCRRAWRLAHDRKKNHERRAKGKPEVTVVELAEMHGAKCHICKRKIDMTLPGLHRMGPTVDHLVPVSQGGTNDTLNLALAHRECNTRRSNRGPAQLRLVA